MKTDHSCHNCRNTFSCRSNEPTRFCSQSCAKMFESSFLGDAVMSQTEIAKRLGISVAAVKYHEKKAMRKLVAAAHAAPILMEYFQ